MKAVKVKERIHWVGVIDWLVRNFHGYTTNWGATYGVYPIIDEKITLIDTTKSTFSRELLERTSSVVDPSKIDYIIANHVETDHSGRIPTIKETCPDAMIIIGRPSDVKGLTAHCGEYPYQAAKGGDTLSIGKWTLTFIQTPMLHRPDNMVIYCPGEKILFSNDAFGQHFTSGEWLDGEVDLGVATYEAKKYLVNIVMCYGRQVRTAWKTVSDLEPEIIAPAHNVIWCSHVKEILGAYKKWSDNSSESGTIAMSDSMWYSTELMAVAITEAFTSQGVPAKLFDLKTNHNSDIVPEVLTSKYVVVGLPILNNQMLPIVASFLCYLKSLSPKNRKAFALDPYGWGGQSIKLVEEGLKARGSEICMGMGRQVYAPTNEQLRALEERVEQIIRENEA